MSKIDIISIVESAMHPNYSGLYAKKGLQEVKVNSIRKAINLIKKETPQYIAAEFFYAYSTNYSGVHKSNLDVLLVSLRKYAPEAKVIVFSDKEDARHIHVLDALGHPIHGLLIHPSSQLDMQKLLE
jgi:hypothetical protein